MLMEMVSKHTITIKELETLITEEKEKYEILERKFQYEEARNDELCLKLVQISMFTLMILPP